MPPSYDALMLSVGLIGLPNVGKSSLFNALTAGAAAVSNYPFTTIDSNVGVVAVPDERLALLAERISPREVTPAHIRFIDIAGLVEGASRGEGLGNRFLAAIREVDAVAHVLRAFDDGQVAHVFGGVDPLRDARVVETELLLADLETLERHVARREREWKADPGKHEEERRRLASWRSSIEAGRPPALEDPSAAAELAALGFLTAKPLLFVANVAEDDPEGREAGLEALAAALGASGPEALVLPVSARLEAELAVLEPEERAELQADLGLERSGLERFVEASFGLLGLVRFYTLANGKLRAWEVDAGTLAPRAAGKIHTDMERGFVRAQVASYRDVLEHGDLQRLHELGRLRTEGKAYEIADGDVVEFLFAV